MTSRHICAGALSSILLLGAGSAVAQTSQTDPAQAEQAKQMQAVSEQFQARVDAQRPSDPALGSRSG